MKNKNGELKIKKIILASFFFWMTLGLTFHINAPEALAANRNPILDPIATPQTVAEGHTLTFTLTGSDPDGDPITFSGSYGRNPLSTLGASLDPITGVFTWTPNFDQSNQYDLQFAAFDGNLYSDRQTVHIIVNNTNRPPAIDPPIPDQLTSEGQLLTFTVTASDPDVGDTLTYSAVLGNGSPLPDGAVLDSNTGVFSWTPNYDQAKVYYLNFAVTDKIGARATQSDVKIAVSDTNRPPVLNPIPDQATNEGVLLTFTVTASDPDGDTITYSAALSGGSSLPEGATLDANTGVFNWIPDNTQVGPYPIIFMATDSKGATSVPQTATITVLNGSPILTDPGNKTVAANDLLSFTLEATDPNGDTLTYSAALTGDSKLPDGASIDSETGVFSWKPTLSQVGVYQITFKVEDKKGGSDSKEITITVNAEELFGTTLPFNCSNSNLNYQLAEVAASGAKWLRAGITWNVIEPTAPVNNIHKYNFNDTGFFALSVDDLIKKATNKGLKMMITVGAQSQWGMQYFNPDDYKTPGYHPTYPPLPEHQVDYNSFIYELVYHYLQLGYSNNIVWQIQNEPNASCFWLAAPLTDVNGDGEINFLDRNVPNDQAAYADLLKNAYTYAHQALQDYRQATQDYSQNVVVIPGGLSCAEGKLYNTKANKKIGYDPILKYVKAWLNVILDTHCFDGLDFHNYYTISSDTSGNIQICNRTFEGYSQVMLSEYGDWIQSQQAQGHNATAKPVWLIEVGVDSHDVDLINGNGDTVTIKGTEAQQSDDLVDMYYYVHQSNATAKNNVTVAHMFLNEIQDLPEVKDDPNIFFRYMGIYDTGWNPKLAFTSYTQLAHGGPVMKTIPDKTVKIAEKLTFTVLARDLNTDQLIYSADNLPTGATFDAGTCTFSWTPDGNQGKPEPYDVYFTASDGQMFNTTTALITVSGVNAPPHLTSIPDQTVNEGALLSFTVSANDQDGDVLAYSANLANGDPLPAGATINSASGLFTWTPGYNQSGVYDITFKVSDGTLSDSETAAITVINFNQPPVLSAIGNKTASPGSLLTFTISGSDPDNDTLSYSVTGLPSGAAFDVNSRIFNWTPTLDQGGKSYALTFSVSDGNGGIASENITITVTSPATVPDDSSNANTVNKAPTLNIIGNKEVVAGELLQFTITALDPDGDNLTFSASNLPAGATFNAGTQTFLWRPNYSQAGIYPAVHFEVSDGTSKDSQDITIAVVRRATNGFNQPLILDEIGDKNVDEGVQLSFTVTASGLNPFLPLYLTVSDLPRGATFIDNKDGTGTFDWTPDYSQAGTYPGVHFEAKNNDASKSEDITITVNNVNQKPKLTPISDKVIKVGKVLTFTVMATDPDNDSLIYTMSGMPIGGPTLGPNTGIFIWKPDESQAGSSYNVYFAVDDGHGGRDTQSITIAVIADNVALAISKVKAEAEGKSAVVTWDTNFPATTQVEYGRSEKYGNLTTANKKLIIKHNVQLTGLKPNILYHYRVISKNSSGEKVSKDYTFKTATSVIHKKEASR